MPTRIRFVAAAVLCGAIGACQGPYCPKGYDQIDDTCYRRKDAGSLDAGAEEDDASHSDTADASQSGTNDGDDITPEAKTDADAERESVGAGRDATDGGYLTEDASVTTSGDAAAPCVSSAEVCDGRDNDCDGRVDEDKQTWYCDDDGDGFAANADGKIASCEKPSSSDSCSDWTTAPPSGPNGRDCDDETALRFPGAGFGLAVGSNGDLNCDGQTETQLEFVAEAAPLDYFSSATRFNICEQPRDEVLGSGDAAKCNCWYSFATAKAFRAFDTDGLLFETSAGGAVVPYFMPTFPCSERPGDVILLQHASIVDALCTQDRGGAVAVRQLCR